MQARDPVDFSAVCAAYMNARTHARMRRGISKESQGVKSVSTCCFVGRVRVPMRMCLFIPLIVEELAEWGEEEDDDEDNEDWPGVVRRKSFIVTSHFTYHQARLPGLRRSLEPASLSPSRRRSWQAGW